MRKERVALCIALSALTACATTPPSTRTTAGINDARAVRMAAAAAPKGIAGVFSIKVQSTGEKRGFLFLDSQRDYRDQRNLTIEITPRAAARMRAQFRESPLDIFKGEAIHVTGVARRVKIVFLANGRRTDKYYYQTHVRVTDPRQIHLDGA